MYSREVTLPFGVGVEEAVWLVVKVLRMVRRETESKFDSSYGPFRVGGRWLIDVSNDLFVRVSGGDAIEIQSRDERDKETVDGVVEKLSELLPEGPKHLYKIYGA